MSSNAANVRVGVSGGVFRGPVGSIAPTGTSGAPDAAFIDLGYISEDGVEITVPASGDSTPIKAWQGGTTVRVIRSASEDQPTWHFTMLETSLATVEAYVGVTVTQTATEGSFEYVVQNRGHDAYVVDIIDGAELMRDHVPYGIVTEVGSHTASNGDPIGYEVTVAGELDPTTGYNFKRWATALKSAV